MQSKMILIENDLMDFQKETNVYEATELTRAMISSNESAESSPKAVNIKHVSNLYFTILFIILFSNNFIQVFSIKFSFMFISVNIVKFGEFKKMFSELVFLRNYTFNFGWFCFPMYSLETSLVKGLISFLRINRLSLVVFMQTEAQWKLGHCDNKIVLQFS